MLTPRQAEVARLVAQGLSNKAIAQRTGITADTVNDHIRAAAATIPEGGKPRHKLTLLVLHAAKS